MTKLQDAQANLEAKQKELEALFKSGGEDMDLSADTVDEIKQRNAELNDLGDTVIQLKEMEAIARKNRERMAENERIERPVSHAAGASDEPQGTREVKSLGELFVESDAFKGYRRGATSGPVATVDVETKTTMATTAGFAPQLSPTSKVIDIAQQMPRVIDFFPTTTTSETAVTYYEETTFTNNAAEVSEAGAYGEAALAYTKRTVPIEKIGVWMPVTDEQLADVPGMADRINNRLTLMLRKRLDAQLIAGDGTPPNITGLAHLASILTQSGTGIPAPDAVYKAIVKINATDGFADATGILLHPLDWQDIRLLTTADGLYIFGSPNDPGVTRMWGLPVATSTALSQNTGYVGDFAEYAELAYKAGIEFEITNAHSTYFASGIMAVRAQLRVAAVYYRASAFCSVTSI